MMPQIVYPSLRVGILTNPSILSVVMLLSFCNSVFSLSNYCASAYWNSQTQECLVTCRDGYYKVLPIMQCSKQCAPPYTKDQANKYCSSPCPSQSPNEIYSSKLKSCVNHCYQNGSNQFYNPQTGKCQDYCPQSLKPDAQSGFCLTSKLQCPMGFFQTSQPRRCYINCQHSGRRQIFRDYMNGKCVGEGECPYDSWNKIQTYGSFYFHGNGRQCVDQCSLGTYGDPVRKICVLKCEGEYPYKDPVRVVCRKSPYKEGVLENNWSEGKQRVDSGVTGKSSEIEYIKRSEMNIVVFWMFLGMILMMVGGTILYKRYLGRYFRRFEGWNMVERGVGLSEFSLNEEQK